MKCDNTPEWKFACDLVMSLAIMLFILALLTHMVPAPWYAFDTGYL